MPILTGTIDDVTGSPLPDRVPLATLRVTVRAPSRRSSLTEQARLVASVPVPVEVSPTGEISVELEPGPAVMLVEGEGLRDVYELGVTADMTLLTEALQEMSPTRSWVESQMVQLRSQTVTAAGDAQAAKSDAEGAASVAEGHRTHVDAIRELLDEAAQTNVAPYLTDTALKATYGTKAEVQSVAGSVSTETQTRAANDADVLSQATAAGVASSVASAAYVRPSDLATRSTLTPDGRSTFDLFTGSGSGATGGDWATRIIPTGSTESAGPTTPAGGPSTRFTITGAQTADFTLQDAEPRSHAPGSIVHAWLWVDDPAAISQASIMVLSGPSSASTTWQRFATNLSHGWNLVRIAADSGVLTSWGQPRRITLRIITTAATGVAWGRVWVECPRKAQMVFVEDRGYRTFIDIGLPALRSRSVPVTWALDMALNSPDTSGPHITDAEVMQFAGQGDVMSIHAYDGAVTATMTPAQIRQDALRAQGWLLDKGLPADRFRAAYTQNNAPNASAAAPFFPAQATSTNQSASLDTWPHVNPQNVKRYQLHGRDNATIDSVFAQLKATHGLFIPYTHGIGTGSTSDMTQAGWDYFLSKVDTAFSEGWLEATTWPAMLAKAGGIVR